MHCLFSNCVANCAMCVWCCFCRFMPVLKYIVENAVRPEHRLLRGKTIECISLVGLAVGAQKVRMQFTILCITVYKAL